ncbi:MAG: hypothetical protein HGN29_13970 [Asgard group archaeon]|nr:hypothetical protein [Asgard group archaeon]
MTHNNEMNSVIDLDKLERKTFLLYFQDGLWDLCLGFTWIAFGIGTYVYDFLPNPMNSLLGPLLFVIGFISFLLGKRYFTLTRVGIVKLRRKKQPRIIALAIVTAAMVLLTILAVILTVTGVLTFNGLSYGVGIIFGLIPIVIFSILAYFLKYSRIIINGILMGIGLFVNEQLHTLDYRQYSGIPLIITGVIILGIGILYLIFFLRKYPINGGENADGR